MGKTVNRYAKISVKVWGDDKFLRLSKPKPNGQTLWFYLMSGPHKTALPCAFQAGEASLAEALDWPLASFRKCFGEVFDKGMAQADWKARLVFVPNALKHNPPESPNVVVGWRSAFNELPECALKGVIFAAVKVFLDVWALDKEKGEVFVKAFGEDFVQSEHNIAEHNRDITEQNRSLGKRETAPPENLEITPEMRAWAKGEGFSPELIAEEIQAMLDHHRGLGNTRLDWIATWRTWMRKSRKYGASNGNGKRAAAAGADAADDWAHRKLAETIRTDMPDVRKNSG